MSSHHPIEMQNYIFDHLMAGRRRIRPQAFGIPPRWIRCAGNPTSCRGRELSIELRAFESALDASSI